MTSELSLLCDDDRLQAVVGTIEQDSEAGLEAIERALAEFPEDARLHFLRGSLLIGARRFVEAHSALELAVSLAPDFQIARFQLGFFELTSGEAEAARVSWAPLKQVLSASHYLAEFVSGLEALIADRFADCIAALSRGIAANSENPPLNHDMELIIEKCAELLVQKPETGQQDDPDDVSAASFLLGARRH
jgi:hypothetical protein